MSRIAYVNGRYLPRSQAAVSIEDRGYNFADGVYEVCEVREGRLIDERRHIDRLKRSLAELRIAEPMSPAALGPCCGRPYAAIACTMASSMCRSAAELRRRDHAFPPEGTKPSLMVTARSIDLAANEKSAAEGIAVITVPDERWARVDIKSISLLPNVLAKQAAREQGAREAWLVDKSGKITEGSSSNAWIINRDGKLMTRSLGRDILAGITRTVLLDVIKAHDLVLEERSFTVEEAYAAREAFVTSQRRQSCPWSASMAGRSAMARRASWRARCGAIITVTPRLASAENGPFSKAYPSEIELSLAPDSAVQSNVRAPKRRMVSAERRNRKWGPGNEERVSRLKTRA